MRHIRMYLLLLLPLPYTFYWQMVPLSHAWKWAWIFEVYSENGCGKLHFLGMKSDQDLKNQAAHPHQEFPGAPSRKNLLSARLHSSENSGGKVVFGLFSDEENQKVRESEGLGFQHFYSWRFRFWQQYCWTYTENVPNDATLRFFSYNIYRRGLQTDYNTKNLYQAE